MSGDEKSADQFLIRRADSLIGVIRNVQAAAFYEVDVDDIDHYEVRLLQQASISGRYGIATIARQMGLHRHGLTRPFTKLARLGYVEKKPAEDRTVHIILTKRGDRVLARYREALKKRLSVLSDEPSNIALTRLVELLCDED